MSLKQRAPGGPRATAAGEEREAAERGAAGGAVVTRGRRAGAREGEGVIGGLLIQCIVKRHFSSTCQTRLGVVTNPS